MDIKQINNFSTDEQKLKYVVEQIHDIVSNIYLEDDGETLALRYWLLKAVSNIKDRFDCYSGYSNWYDYGDDEYLPESDICCLEYSKEE
jgi:hypothetical protein